MFDAIIDSASWILLLAGGAFSILGAVGVLRMPDFYTRMHAGSLTDTAGMALMLAGLMLQAGLSIVAIKLVLIVAFLLITGPTASHALARAALHDGVQPLLADDERQP